MVQIALTGQIGEFLRLLSEAAEVSGARGAARALNRQVYSYERGEGGRVALFYLLIGSVNLARVKPRAHLGEAAPRAIWNSGTVMPPCDLDE
jgi:hypothetical protein